MAAVSVLERINGWGGVVSVDHPGEKGSPLDTLKVKDAPWALVVHVEFDHPSPDSNPPSWYHLNPGNLARFTEALQCNSARTCEQDVSSNQVQAAEAAEEQGTAGDKSDTAEEEKGREHTQGAGGGGGGGGEGEDDFEDAEEDEFEEAEGFEDGEGEGTADLAQGSADVAGGSEEAPKHTVWCTFAWAGEDEVTDDVSRVEAAGKQLGTLLHLLTTQDAPARIKATSTTEEGDSLLMVVQGHVTGLQGEETGTAPHPIIFEFRNAAGEAPEDIRLGVNWAEFKGSVPRGNPADPDPRNCWMVPEGATFTLKSETFFEDGIKEESGAPQCQLVAVDWLHHSERISGVCRRKAGLVQRVRRRHGGSKAPFFVAVNLQVPAGGSGHYSMVFYFAAEQGSPCLQEGTLLHEFIHCGDDEFRKHRLGLIPAIPQGSWLIRNAVGNGTVVTLGEALALSYVEGEGFFEIEVNMGTSSVVSGILGLVVPCMSMLTVDMAFFVKAEEGDPLPEKLFGVVRCCNLEQSSAIELEDD